MLRVDVYYSFLLLLYAVISFNMNCIKITWLYHIIYIFVKQIRNPGMCIVQTICDTKRNHLWTLWIYPIHAANELYRQ